MSEIEVTTSLTISQVFLRPGDRLTVWIGGELKRVELRVLRDGRPELFSEVPALNFDQHYKTDGAAGPTVAQKVTEIARDVVDKSEEHRQSANRLTDICLERGKRIEHLETELKRARDEHSTALFDLEKANERVVELREAVFSMTDPLRMRAIELSIPEKKSDDTSG